LFNRNGQTCRGLYDELYPSPSKTRTNLDEFASRLAAAGITEVLQTNVVCYSTPMSADLRRTEHRMGSKLGGRIFDALLKAVRPKVVVLHGAGTCKAFEQQFDLPVPRPPADAGDGIRRSTLSFGPFETEIIAIPSLAPPGFNMWSAWAPRYLDAVSAHIAGFIHW
jgi:hypothetical protein